MNTNQSPKNSEMYSGKVGFFYKDKHRSPKNDAGLKNYASEQSAVGGKFNYQFQEFLAKKKNLNLKITAKSTKSAKLTGKSKGSKLSSKLIYRNKYRDEA